MFATTKITTTKTETGFVDVQSGSIHLPYGFLIIAGNLSANDKLHPSGGQTTINETLAKTYSTGTREQTNTQTK